MKLTRLQARQLLQASFPEYRGRSIDLELTPTVILHDVNWGGGSKNYYKFLRSDGSIKALPVPAPWVNPYEGLRVELPNNAVIVCHKIFCGHDLGITIYASPALAPKWLTA